MKSATLRRSGAIFVSAVLLASLAVTATAIPVAAKPTCNGVPTTIVGTAKNDVIRGTRGRDVIFAGAGNDVVYGGGGGDYICGGRGNDRLFGGAGSDRLMGQLGRDRLFGRVGDDDLFGGRGRDRLFGDAGRDVTDGGYGHDVCRPGPGLGPHVHCEDVLPVTPQDLAIAWSDLDGDHRYGPGDVLISRLFDTNGDGIPSKGDTIYMGRYPTDFGMTAFADFGVTSHRLGRPGHPGQPWGYGRDLIYVYSVGLDLFDWSASTEVDAYSESVRDQPQGGGLVLLLDNSGRTGEDYIRVSTTSASRPVADVDLGTELGRRRDDGFIDVVIYP